MTVIQNDKININVLMYIKKSRLQLKRNMFCFFEYRLNLTLIDFLFILLTNVLEAKMSLKQQHKEEIAPETNDTCVPLINTYHL